jgi:hypothetical protein
MNFFDLFVESYRKALGTGPKLSVHPSLPRPILSAQKNYLLKENLENSKQPQKFSKIQYVTTDDVYYL